MVICLALVLNILASACLYLASPNQKWLAPTPPRRVLLVTGGMLLGASLAAWMAALRPLAGFFVTLHVAMVCLFAFPYAATLRGDAQAPGRAVEVRPDWWSKASAGAILGFGLALSLAGVYAYLGEGGILAPVGRYSLMRMLEALVWIAVFGFCFLFRSGRAAWLWLGAANLISFAALFACRFYFFA